MLHRDISVIITTDVADVLALGPMSLSITIFDNTSAVFSLNKRHTSGISKTVNNYCTIQLYLQREFIVSMAVLKTDSESSFLNT